MLESYYEMCSGPVGLQYVPMNKKANNASSSSSSKAKNHSTPTKNELSPASMQSVSFQCEQANGTAKDTSGHMEARTAVSNNAIGVSETSNGCSTRRCGESGTATGGGEAQPQGTAVSTGPVSELELDCARASIDKSAILPSVNSKTAVTNMLPSLLLNKNVSQDARNCSQVTKENSEWSATLVCLQETWLLNHDCTVSVDFEYIGKSSVDNGELLVGRPYGGVAILWRKGIFDSVSAINCNSDRLLAIKATIGGRSILVFCVYMPVKARENLPIFTDILSKISSIEEGSGVQSVIILGDFNAQPGQLFFTKLNSFCTDRSWVCADIEFLGIHSDTFT
ncbi:unnamed protein product, partial [Brenthis ino]